MKKKTVCGRRDGKLNAKDDKAIARRQMEARKYPAELDWEKIREEMCPPHCDCPRCSPCCDYH